MNPDVKVVGPEYLVPLIHRAVATIKVDLRRRPESLPPRLLIPGSTKILWLESDWLAWLEGCRTAASAPLEIKPRHGQPRSQLI